MANLRAVMSCPTLSHVQLCAPAVFLAASRHLLALSHSDLLVEGEVRPTVGEVEGFVSSAAHVMQQLLASAEGEVAMEAA